MSTERVTRFVETSGTQSTPKLIPVTKSWSQHVQNAQMLWVLALLRDYPAISNGAILHNVSAANERTTDIGVPIGANTGRMVDALPREIQRRFVLSPYQIFQTFINAYTQPDWHWNILSQHG